LPAVEAAGIRANLPLQTAQNASAFARVWRPVHRVFAALNPVAGQMAGIDASSRTG
jgi:hypothetical protein